MPVVLGSLVSLATSLLAIVFMAEEQPATSSLNPATSSAFSAQLPASTREPAYPLHPAGSTLEQANPFSTQQLTSILQPAASAPEPASTLQPVSPLQQPTHTVEPAASHLEPVSVLKPQKYVLRYTGNKSKKWDGKEIILHHDYLQSLVEESELVPGQNVKLPWSKRGGGTEVWNAVIVGAM